MLNTNKPMYFSRILAASKINAIADSTQIEKICKNIGSANIEYFTLKNKKVDWPMCDNNLTLKM